LGKLTIGATTGQNNLQYLRREAHMPKVRVCLLALRKKQAELARSQLAELVAEFPLKSPFASELAKLGGRAL
jgi:hypothetical protein